MMQNVCFTSCNNKYLDRAGVLADSFKRYHPEWRFVVLLSDRIDEVDEIIKKLPSIDEIFMIRDLKDVYSESWAFMHDPEEICTAVKPFYAKYLLDLGVKKIIFLDPDVVVLRPLPEITSRLEEDVFLLTPHVWAPSINKRHIELHEISSLAHGVYNLGFFALSSGHGSRSVVSYWCDRLRDYCYRDHSSGVFTDQKWANFFPIFFDAVRVMKERTLNVSSWNLVNVSLRGSIPKLYNGADQIGFLHFSGLNSDVFIWAASQVGEMSNTVVSIFEWYKDAVIRKRLLQLPESRLYNQYMSGRVIRKSHRIHYRTNEALWATYKNPFDDTSESNFYDNEVSAKENALLNKYENPEFIPRHY